ncbi:protein ACCELERATED CELL DEATH 6-like [Nicotiana sylvestris]|uniref:Ankyrin repeat-containing protein At3g12360-like n=1 Tax=Nicotiana sylvestris TaxID=4096 RepID=A0A1U7YEB6_NICSY|nr:PREDICTED: ankyrin repeat-containing protein At3g12360-like [Nicotiana sylvestris]
MDPTLYKAAVEGNTGEGDDFLPKLTGDEEIGYQFTQKGNTVIHVAALYGHSDFVQRVLTISPALLCRQNKKHETALHVAANEGHAEVVRVLLSEGQREAKQLMMRKTDDKGDTALHKAVRKRHFGVVTLLVKEDPDFEFPANSAGETPLYLAVESNFLDALREILRYCNRPSYSGPSQRNPMHAAIIFKYSECINLLWQWNKSLCEEADQWGWNSLHYAIKLGSKEVVSDLLGWKKSLAYITTGNGDDWTTTFHIAANEGYVTIMKELLKHCPDCWEMLNSQGQNALHIAILNKKKKVVKFLLNSPEYLSLIDETDNDGNTPLHLLAASEYCEQELIKHPRAKNMAFNKKNQTPQDVAMSAKWTPSKGIMITHLLRIGRFGGRDVKIRLKDKKKPMTENEKEKRKEEDEKMKDKVMTVAQTHLVVATLIVTITFAAGFTLPGGFDSNPGPNQGMAILIRKAAFKAFVYTNTIAFVCSTGAVFSYFTMAARAVLLLTKNHQSLILLYVLATHLQLLAMAALVLAFVTGMFAILAHSMGVAVTAIGCISFLIYFCMLYMVFNWKSYLYIPAAKLKRL